MENRFLNDDEVINYENTLYVNPETSLRESNQFIDNLRNIQNQNTAGIGQETAQLGSYPVPQSNLGGLGGGGSYFESRYSTPQGVALANNLMATNRATALTEAMQNNLAIQKQRLSNAQRAAQMRANELDIPEDGYDRVDVDQFDVDYGSGSVSGKGMKDGSTRTGYVMDGYSYTQDILPDGRRVISNTDNTDNYTQAANGYWYYTGGVDESFRKTIANAKAAEQLLSVAKRTADARMQSGGGEGR